MPSLTLITLDTAHRLDDTVVVQTISVLLLCVSVSGRLNVLANVVRKPMAQIFSEFTGKKLKGPDERDYTGTLSIVWMYGDFGCAFMPLLFIHLLALVYNCMLAGQAGQLARCNGSRAFKRHLVEGTTVLFLCGIPVLGLQSFQ